MFWPHIGHSHEEGAATSRVARPSSAAMPTGSSAEQPVIRRQPASAAPKGAASVFLPGFPGPRIVAFLPREVIGTALFSGSP